MNDNQKTSEQRILKLKEFLEFQKNNKKKYFYVKSDNLSEILQYNCMANLFDIVKKTNDAVYFCEIDDKFPFDMIVKKIKLLTEEEKLSGKYFKPYKIVKIGNVK